MKKKITSVAICAAVAACSLAAPVYALDSSEEYYRQYQDQGISINVYNWGEYISDGSEGALDVNKEFEELTGIKVVYSTFATNEELYAKLQSGAVNYDIIIPSDYMIARMIREDMLEKLDYDRIPAFANIDNDYKNPEYDPANEYSVPYTWGTVGIIYNTTMVEDTVDSWDILWNEKYSGNILMFSNPRDALGIAQKKLGYSFNTTNMAEIESAFEQLRLQKPLVQAYVMDEIFDKMQSGEAAIAPYYAGDAITMIADNPDLAFASPKEGTNRFVDAICIPKGAANKEAAHLYINYLCEPEVAAANIEYIGYSTPISAARELMDPEMANSPISYPADEIMEKSEFFLALPDDVNVEIDRLWTDLLSGKTEGNSNITGTIVTVLVIVVAAAAVMFFLVQKKRREASSEEE